MEIFSFHQISLSDLLWDFDALSLYAFAMWDEKSTFPKIETGYAFTVHMNDELIHTFNNQTFTQGRAISNVFYYNPKNFNRSKSRH